MERFENFDWWYYLLEIALFSLFIVVGFKIIGYFLNKFFSSDVIKNSNNLTFLTDKKFITLVSMSGTLSKFLGFILVVIYCLSPFVDLSKLLAGAGVLGIILGFGAQSLIKDILTGFFFLFENQLHQGDFVTINNKYTGTVEEVGFRALKIREWGGNVLSISNGNIIEILNGNVDKRRVVEGVLVSYNEDPENVRRVLSDVCNELNLILKDNLMVDSDGNIIEDFRIRGVMDLTRNRGAFEYTIVGLVNDETYFDSMYKTREVLVNHIYKNNLRLVEDRVLVYNDIK